MAENPNKISQIQIGAVTYDICDATARNHTITDDDYIIVDNNLDLTSEINNNYIDGKSFLIKDSEGQSRVSLKGINYEPSGNQGFRLQAHRSVNKGDDYIDDVYNTLELVISPTGQPIVGMTQNSKSAWRSTLELGTTAPSTILWSGTNLMTSGTDQVANLSANISTCPSGVALHWQPYIDEKAVTYYHRYTFVPKNYPFGQGLMVTLFGNLLSNFACKYIYVHDNKIVGNDSNDDTGTSNGITYTNNWWVLTQVIAV